MAYGGWAYRNAAPKTDAGGAGAGDVNHVDKDALAKVERGNLRIVLLSEGKINAKESVKISHTIEGTLTIAKIATEGSYVEKGQELRKPGQRETDLDP